jgi:hypothetical protein
MPTFLLRHVAHAHGGVIQPTLTNWELMQLSEFFPLPAINPSAVHYAKAALQALRTFDYELQFNGGSVLDAMSYQLIGCNNNPPIPLARLGSNAVLWLLDQGYITEEGELTELGETAPIKTKKPKRGTAF